MSAPARVVGPEPLRAKVAERILRGLPEWFGIESALLAYAAEAESHRNFIALVEDEVAGFVTLVPHNRFTLELHCLALSRAFHRTGIGTQLCRAAESWWGQMGGKLVQVKTLGPSHPDPNYAKSRLFYEAQGFVPVEEFAELWPGVPCLLLVKALASD